MGEIRIQCCSLEEFDELFAAESEQMGHWIMAKTWSQCYGILPCMVDTQAVQGTLQSCRITNNVKAGHGPSMTRDPAKANAVAEVMQLFDQVIESSIEGIRKPNPKIYLIACERLGVQPENAIFLMTWALTCGRNGYANNQKH